jgi:hypothetical protein
MKITVPLSSFYKLLLIPLLFPVSSKCFSQAVVDYGKSFINISKGNNGGTIEPGDTLEIRATFVVKSGTAYNASFADAVPANTTYIANTLRILTNEGKIYQQWTDASDGDPATITGSSILINLGTGADNINGGTVANTAKPSFFNGACIMVVSYRLVVTAPLGTILDLGNGSFSYQKTSTAATTVVTFPSANAVVYKNYGMCSNTVGANTILSESGGTFGSGSAKDRVASAKVPANYTYALFNSTSGMPNDYYYGVSNNTSGGSTTAYSISNSWNIPDNSSPSHRIFGVWDIIGDHTGATNPLLGNAPTDDNTGQSGGYMVVINAAYRTDTAFLDTVNNLCPNTYYQYSAWFRNICSKCGCDSNGKGASSASYIPTAPGDSSGVYPNLTFNVNGADYYSTGNMLHTGQWIQKGLTYLTGPTQTSMIIHIRNNAPGGGGNDWAIDDIAVASCLPNIDLTPNKPDTLCQGSDDTVRFKVSSYFNNYTEWQLEKSMDNGVTWSSPGNDTTGAAPAGSSVPVFNNSSNEYEYLVTRYFRLSATDTLTKYRLTVASSASNLSNSNCAITGSASKIIRGINCLGVLATNIISFKGNAENSFAKLQWISTNETGNIIYNIERSDDQINFYNVGTVQGNAGEGLGSTYHFMDAKAIGATTYYRINMVSNPYNKFSTIVLLSNAGINFDLKALTNPFSDWLSFDLTVPDDDVASFTLIDMFGRIVKQQKQNLSKGLNNVRLYNLSNLPEGTYTLQARSSDNIINKKVIKIKN